MSMEFDPRHRRDLDMVRPTESSSWLVVIVLLIGVALAAWYLWVGREMTNRMGPTSGQALSEIGQPSSPPKSAP